MRIYVNQAGYRPLDKKIIVLAKESAGQDKSVNRKEIELRISGPDRDHCINRMGQYYGFDKDSGDFIWKADVTDLIEEGQYIISIDEADEVSFCISDAVYKNVNRLLCKALYFQRCGMALDKKYAGVFHRKCCHMKPAFFLEDFGKNNPIEISGGWHDAGDYGRYTTAAAAALAHILYAYIFFPQNFKTILDIPESNNGCPDILNECKYELEWLFKMQREDGSVCHKLTSMRHANFVMPHEDKNQMILFPASTMATGDFAAVMALASRTYSKYDPNFSKRAISSSRKAWKWLEEHKYFMGFKNPTGCNTGEYEDIDDRDERLWAAAELYRTTGNEKYLQYVDELSKEKIDLTAMGWADVAGFAGWAMLSEKIKNRDDHVISEIEKRFKQAFITKAEHITEMTENSGYNVAMTTADYGWGSNMVLMNRAMITATAYMLEPRQLWKDVVGYQMDYILGINAMGYSYITGIGINSCKNPHNRVTVADHITEIIPGFVVGGPNSDPVDEKAQWIIKNETFPMKCYADVWECYSLNEITIYWNSPAVFITAFLNNERR